jgi:antitoxin CptB
MSEPRETKTRRLHMRSIRRGIKEMDLILTAYAEARLADMSDADLDVYDDLLSQNDHDILAWVLGTQDVPARFADQIASVALMARGLTRPV